MLDLAPYISELLFGHDCVIIPQFGGFVANPHPAKLNRLKSTIEPPFKEIGFNPRLIKNDGLLANHLREKEEMSYEKALSDINQSVEGIRRELQAGKTYRLKGIGTFYLDSQKSLRFSASHESNFNLDFFGFEPILAISLNREEKELIREEKEELASKNVIDIPTSTVSPEEKRKPETKTEPKVVFISEKKEKSRDKWKNRALIAACIPLLFYLTWLPTRMDVNQQQVKFHWSDLNPYSTEPCPLYEQRETLPDLLEIYSPKVGFFKDLAKSNSPYVKTSFFEKTDPNYSENELVIVALNSYKAEALSTKVVHAFVPPTQVKAFYVIGGCFREYSNANNYINTLRKQGFPAVLVDKKGSLYRVAINGSNNRQEVLNQLTEIQKKGYSDAWILKK